MSSLSTKPIIAVIGQIVLEKYELQQDPGKKAFSISGTGIRTAIAAYRASKDKPDPPGSGVSGVASPAGLDVRLVGVIGVNGSARTIAIKMSDVRTFTKTTDDEPPLEKIGFLVEKDARGNDLVPCSGKDYKLRPIDFISPRDLGNGERPDLVVCQLGLRGRGTKKSALEVSPVVWKIVDVAGEFGIPVVLTIPPGQGNPLEMTKSLYRWDTVDIMGLMKSGHVKHLIVGVAQSAPTKERGVDRENVLATAEQYVNYGIENVIITFGKDGLFFCNEKTSGPLQAFDVGDGDDRHPHQDKLVGVRDTFTGVYAAELQLTSLGEPWEIEGYAKYASRAAALLVRNFTRMNRVNDIPWADEIREFDNDVRMSWSDEENSNFGDSEMEDLSGPQFSLPDRSR